MKSVVLDCQVLKTTFCGKYGSSPLFFATGAPYSPMLNLSKWNYTWQWSSKYPPETGAQHLTNELQICALPWPLAIEMKVWNCKYAIQTSEARDRAACTPEMQMQRQSIHSRAMRPDGQNEEQDRETKR